MNCPQASANRGPQLASFRGPVGGSVNKEADPLLRIHSLIRQIAPMTDTAPLKAVIAEGFGEVHRLKTLERLGGPSGDTLVSWLRHLREVSRGLPLDTEHVLIDAVATALEEECAGIGQRILRAHEELCAAGNFTGLERETRLVGRIVGARPFGKKLTFLDLHTGGRVVECVYENPPRRFNIHAFVEFKGAWRNKVRREGSEFVVSSLGYYRAPPVDSAAYFSEMLQPLRIEARQAMRLAEQVAVSFLTSRDYQAVHSPSIVGDWVRGQTGAFQIDYYRDEKAYLSISPMLHHHLIQLLGHKKVFEITRLFRREDNTSMKRLCEFHNVAVGIIGGTVEDMVGLYSDLLGTIWRRLRQEGFRTISVPEVVEFSRVSYRELLSACAVENVSGHQLNAGVRKYLEANFSSFVWITGFPEHTRPFYVKSVGGFCEDCQLWYRGRNYLAAGGVVEECPETILAKMVREGKDPTAYRFYLDAISTGLPPIASIDMGLERLLGTCIQGTHNGDYTFFPRYEGRLNP